MIKRKISPVPPLASPGPPWLELDAIAAVEFTSEEPGHPIETALAPGDSRGWRADAPGPQIIRLRFHQPRRLRHICVLIEERHRARTQEFVLRHARDPEGPWQEIIRQQFNFSPAGSTRQLENYYVNLPSVAVLELVINPDIAGSDARASLQELRVA